MQKTLSKIIASLIFTFILGITLVHASGKIEVKIGGEVNLKGESTLTGATYQWVTKKDKTVLNKQVGQNYKYKFNNQGEYTVDLTASSGSKSEGTTVNVLVGERYSSKISQTVAAGTQSLYMILETLPQLNADKQVVLYGDSGKVHFLMEQSVGDIIEYRIDKNVYEDSDGNGVANDDIDNSNGNSYLTGSAWSTTYKKGKTAKITAQITLVDKKGKKVSDKVDIVFQDQVKTNDLTAVFDVSPTPSAKDGLVHLYKATHEVAFYSQRSTGDIIEYRIDKNIFVDSDNNGNPSDDIDNLNDISFKTGDVWTTTYTKTENQITAQLIVVGKAGKGSRIQKGIVFGAKPTPPAPSITSVKDGISLVADKSLVYKGDPITFTVSGLQLGMSEYTFNWDLDGDGTVDKEVTGDNTIKHSFSKVGLVKVQVSIVDKKKNKLDKNLEITVKETPTTKADFTYKVEGGKVTFTNSSTVDHNLSNKTLTYLWSFGDTDSDNYKKQENQKGVQNPVYTYIKPGKYVVVLTVTDADKVTDSKTQNIEITSGDSSGTTKGSGGSIFVKILKILLYLVIIVIVLIILIVGGFLIFLKVQQPDLTFEELIDELKVKILTKIGAYDEHEPEKSTATEEATVVADTPPPSAVEAEEVDDDNAGANHDSSNDNDNTDDETASDEYTDGDVKEPSKHDFVSTEEAPATEEGPTPSWLGDKDVIEGEEVDETSINEDTAETQDFVSEEDDDATEDEVVEDDLSGAENLDEENNADEEESSDITDDTTTDQEENAINEDDGTPDWLNDTGADDTATGENNDISNEEGEEVDEVPDSDENVETQDLASDDNLNDADTDDNIPDDNIGGADLPTDDEQVTDETSDEEEYEDESEDAEEFDDFSEEPEGKTETDASDFTKEDSTPDWLNSEEPQQTPTPEASTGSTQDSSVTGEMIEDATPPAEPNPTTPTPQAESQQSVQKDPQSTPQVDETPQSEPRDEVAESQQTEGQPDVPDWLKGE